MTHEDTPEQATPAEPATRRRAGRGWYVFGGFLFVFLGGSALLWFLRKPVAEQALAAWCAERDLQCDAKFTELDASGISVTALKVSAGSAVPAEASDVHATLRWTGLFTPEVTGITVNGLALRGTLDARGLKFGGLESLAQSGGGGGPAPPVDIRGARIELDTPAGRTGATLDFTGTLPRDGSLSVKLDAGELSNPFARADIAGGRLDVRAVNGVVQAELGLTVNQASVSDYSLDGFDLIARGDLNEDASQPAAFEWSVRAARIASPDLRATDIRTNGSVDFTSLPGSEPASLLNELAGALFEGDAASLTVGGYTFDQARFNGQLSGREGVVSGPLIAETGIATGPAGSATSIALAGEMSRQASGAAAFDGQLSVTGAALDADLRARAGEAFSLPGVLSAHVGSLRAALDRALSKFDAEVAILAETDGKFVSVSAKDAATLQAASGLRLTVTPDTGTPWVRVTPKQLLAQGEIALSGGGAPSVSLDVAAFRAAPGSVTLQADAFDLDSWSVGGRTLAARLRGIRLENVPAELVLTGEGQLSFAGEVGGVNLARTTLKGGLDAARDDTGWRVQSAGAPCLAINTQGLTLGAIALAPADFSVCPVNGRFMRQGPVPGGSAVLGAVSLPFTMESGAGTLDLAGAAIDWSAAKGFDLTVRAEGLDLPLTLGERTLTIAGGSPRIDIRTGSGPAAIAARLGKTQFGGTLIPANVSASAFSFDGVSAASGVEGKVSGTGVLITDLNEDPIYAPITSEFTGTIGDNRLRMTGPLVLKAQSVPLADAAVDLDIIKLDGTASVISRAINFRPGALQPDMISGRLTGLFTEASGSLATDARFVIEGGDIAGTAVVQVRDFGFQTTRLGRVTGVNGRVYFEDLMGLSTSPAQEFRLASVNPGIPLTNGRIVFDLREGETLHLDTVTFPFGGGKLAIAPFDWALAGGLNEQTVSVTADKIDLSQLVEVLRVPDTTATGTVSGSFPIEFKANRVLIKDARLKADDPGGRLSYTGGAVDAAAGQDANASLAFDALRDLKFNVLEIGISGDLAGDMRADLLLAGENIKPLPLGNKMTLPAGQAFEFAMGFDLPIGKLIENNLGLVSQQDVIDATIELLNTQRAEEAKTAQDPPAE